MVWVGKVGLSDAAVDVGAGIEEALRGGNEATARGPF